jgi:hypothetical protein
MYLIHKVVFSIKVGNITHTHTHRFYGHFSQVSKLTPVVFQDNPGWPFSHQMKWINSQIWTVYPFQLKGKWLTWVGRFPLS